MLKTSYFVPHSPVLISNIGKEHTKELSKTESSFKRIREELENDTPDTLIVLSAHSPAKTDTVTINLHQKYLLDLSEFGDLTTRHSWRPDVETINHIVYESGKHYTINFISESKLDYGTSIPLHILTENLPAIKIVPITYGELPLTEIFRFGQVLEGELSKLGKTYSIISTGDLSHRLNESSVSGFSPMAKDFDNKVQKAFKQNTLSELQSLEIDMLKEVGQCGLRALLILAGALQHKKVNSKIYSYENSLGIGYLTGALELN